MDTTTTPDHHVDRLPGDGRGLFLTDSGLETWAIFAEGIDLPHFAAITMLDHDRGRDALDRYVQAHIAVARRHGVGLVADAPTWRAGTGWGALLGMDARAVERANRRAVQAIAAHRPGTVPVVISGVVGPRGDGYVVDEHLSVDAARSHHLPQVHALAEGGADLVSALTMTHPEEAAGIALAAEAVGVPVVISFTVEVDGRLPSGHRLGEAIEWVDAVTDGAPRYHMVNCAHPTHLVGALEPGAPWMRRLQGLRANASALSHEELDAAEELDRGDPAELAAAYRQLRHVLPDLQVVGGCCGTDADHVDAIARAMA